MSDTPLGAPSPITPSAPVDSPSTRATAPFRGIVVKRGDDPKVALARLMLVADDEGREELQVAGDSPDWIEKIREVAERSAQTPLAATMPDDDLRVRKWTRLVEALEKEGLEVEGVPEGDMQVKFEFDVTTGRGVGNITCLHDFAVQDDALGRRIVASLADAMKKMADDLAARIEVAVASADPGAIISTIREERASGAFGTHPTRRLLDSLMSFDIATFEPTDRQMVRELRLAVAHSLGRYDIAGANAELLLREDVGQLDDSKKAALEMVVALDAMKKGRKETALHIWRKLLRPPTPLDTHNRAWAWRNLSLALPTESAEARHAAKCSADAFLECGAKPEAGKSLLRLADCQMLDNPEQAIQTLNEIATLMDDAGLQGRQLRAAALHARSTRLAHVGRHAAALADTTEAIALLRGIIGAEEQLIGSLYLGATVAGLLGKPDTADALSREADNLTNEVNSPHFKLTRRVMELARSFDQAAANILRDEAEAAGFVDLIAGVRVLQATRDAALSDTERLSLLEDTLQYLGKAGAIEAAKQPAQLALAGELLRLGQTERAEDWYRQVVTCDPLNRFARDSLLQSLWRREKWGDAAIVLKGQIDLLGPMPGLLFAYGRSLFEAGDFSGAVSALTQAIEKAGDNADLEKAAREMRERALRSGGTIVLAPKTTPMSAVTREEFDAALEQFARFIMSEKRMTFWSKSEGSDHSWIERPERHAQNLLHTLLKARFLERVSIFEELASGAGRLDLYVQLYGGLSLILELKICGFGYSSSYAAAGEDQILHYMENRRSHVGYLVVIDARLDGFGRELINAAGPHTVVSKFIDVRPRVTKRRRG